MTLPKQARMDHNARIKADIDAAAPRRAAFLASHLDTLMPFITPQVAAQIRCKTSQKGHDPCLRASGITISVPALMGVRWAAACYR